MNEYIKSIYFKGYKCFNKEDFQEIKDIKNVNVIVGRNNTGKSSVIDIIHYAINESVYAINRQRFGEIRIGLLFDREHMDKFLKENVYGYREHDLKRYLGSEIIVEINKDNYRYQLADKQADEQIETAMHLGQEGKIKQIIDSCYNAPNKSKYMFKRLNAERDIVPEAQNSSETLAENGGGASNLIRVFRQRSDYDEKLIEEELREALNRIVNPEADFTRIDIQQINSNAEPLWEIFFYEVSADKVALSEIGSGFRPLILMLLYLLVIPRIEKKQDRKFVYAFEDIENNLHPALQKRLFEYIYKFAVDNEICIFFTSHSHIAINTFFKKEQAAIYHIKKEENGSVVDRVDTLSDANNLLVDLGVIPSDILQANGIIWVEGEGDRIYLKKWLEIFSEEAPIEYQDYTIMFYGGSSLAHCTFSEDEEDNKINLLRLNKNALLIMDSDKSQAEDKTDRTKKYKTRIKDEFAKQGMSVWETKGREIENYLPKEVIESVIGHKVSKEFSQFDDIVKYYNDNVDDGSKLNKTKFAKKAIEFITYENSKDIFDLKEQISKLYNEIKKWNGQG